MIDFVGLFFAAVYPRTLLEKIFARDPLNNGIFLGKIKEQPG